MRSSHPETRRKFDREFREGAVRVVRETGKPIAQVARDLGVNEGTLGNWCARDRAEREGTDGQSADDAAELKRLRSENAELRMERDVLIGHVEERARVSPVQATWVRAVRTVVK
jgi:transposase-like protein